MSTSDDESGTPSPSSALPATLPAAPTKTPMYEAIHAPRYHRQELIKKIEGEYGRRLICYVSGRSATIDRDDTAGFMELLHNIPPGRDIDLLIHTRGGDVDAAEKMLSLVQATVGGCQLRLIIPEFAKSAGTLMALGADTLLMSDSSELGTIDPQIWADDGQGNMVCHSVLSYIDAYATHAAALRERVRNFAENQLNRKGRNFSAITSALLDTKRWPSHGQMISWQDAKHELTLDVQYLAPRCPQWQSYRRLYCLLRLAVTDKQNIFESAYASLILDQ